MLLGGGGGGGGLGLRRMKTRTESGGHTGESHFLLRLIQHFNLPEQVSERLMARCIIQTFVIKLPAPL